MSVKANLEAVAQKMYGKGIKDLADHDLYFAILQMTKEMMENKGRIQGSKKVYYISACLSTFFRGICGKFTVIPSFPVL